MCTDRGVRACVGGRKGERGGSFLTPCCPPLPPAPTGRKPAFTAGVPVDGCWFCLGSASVDLSLVASVGDEAYLALDKVWGCVEVEVRGDSQGGGGVRVGEAGGKGGAEVRGVCRGGVAIREEATVKVRVCVCKVWAGG